MRRILIFLSALCLLNAAPARASLKDDMNAAHDAAHTGDLGRLSAISQRTDSSLLEMYPHFWLLDAQIQTLPEKTITDFLDSHPDSLLAERLRGDWLRALGRRGDWTLFAREWPKLQQWDIGGDLHCYRLQMAAAQGDDATLTREARPLWFSDHGLPDPCAPVFDTLFTRGLLSQQDAWARVRLALASNNPSFALQLTGRISQQTGIDARLLNIIGSRPDRALSTINLSSRGGRELALFALTRAAHNDLDRGYAMMTQLKQLPAEDIHYGWSQLGSLAIRRLDDRALEWFGRGLAPADLNADGRASYVRAALRHGDWLAVARVIDAMPADEARLPSWRYWRARAWLAADNRPAATQLLNDISGEHSFYGQLAAEELGPMVADVTSGHYRPDLHELEAIRQQPSVARALALYEMDWHNEALREWNWGMRNLNDQQLLAAAEVARQTGWYDRAIYSAERTKSVHDFGLRYVSPYRDITRVYAKSLNLDEAWVYGLIRQESRFVTSAKSGVGAHGLMQLMPATAVWVARKLNINYNPAAVNEVGTNIQLGTFYLRQMLDQLRNQPVLATAAYNAGPGRARAWCGEKPLEGAIYAETIPFAETRDYVKKVMSNAVYYALAFGQSDVSLKRRIGVIPARDGRTVVEDVPQ